MCLRLIIGDRHPHHRVAKFFRELILCMTAPIRHEPERLRQKRILPRHLDLKAAIKTARPIAGIEFMTVEGSPDRSFGPVELIGE